MRLKQAIWVTLIAPKPGEAQPPAPAPKKDKDAGQLFAEQHGGTDGPGEGKTKGTMHEH